MVNAAQCAGLDAWCLRLQLPVSLESYRVEVSHGRAPAPCVVMADELVDRLARLRARTAVLAVQTPDVVGGVERSSTCETLPKVFTPQTHHVAGLAADLPPLICTVSA